MNLSNLGGKYEKLGFNWIHLKFILLGFGLVSLPWLFLLHLSSYRLFLELFPGTLKWFLVTFRMVSRNPLNRFFGSWFPGIFEWRPRIFEWLPRICFEWRPGTLFLRYCGFLESWLPKAFWLVSWSFLNDYWKFWIISWNFDLFAGTLRMVSILL